VQKQSIVARLVFEGPGHRDGVEAIQRRAGVGRRADRDALHESEGMLKHGRALVEKGVSRVSGNVSVGAINCGTRSSARSAMPGRGVRRSDHAVGFLPVYLSCTANGPKSLMGAGSPGTNPPSPPNTPPSSRRSSLTYLNAG
jgi:hypothetical protein